MKSLLRLLCLSVLLAVCWPAMADLPYKPSDIQKALDAHDYPTADREIQAVLAVAPNSAMAHYWDAKILTEEHHAGQALAEVEKAKSLPPPFKDATKNAEFQGNLAKAEVDLQKTVTDEEAALAHPHTTTTTTTTQHVVTTPLRAPASVYVTPVRHVGSPLPIIIGILAVILLVLAIVWIISLLSAPKEKVVVVNNTLGPDRQTAVSSGLGSGPRPGPVYSGTGGGQGYGQRPSVAPVSQPVVATGGHSTSAVVGAGLGGLAAGMLLDEALHSHRTGGYGNGGFGGGFGGAGNGGMVEEIDTTTTSTTTDTFDTREVDDDYRQADNDFGNVGGDSFDDNSSGGDSFSSSDDSF